MILSRYSYRNHCDFCGLLFWGKLRFSGNSCGAECQTLKKGKQAKEQFIHWEKPNLGLTDFGGNKKNNIIWRGKGQGGDHWAGPHGAGIFKDTHEKDPDRRYKSLFKIEKLSMDIHLVACFFMPQYCYFSG